MSEMKVEKGGFSVDTAHIFPIIKQWLYSEKEIFLREIVSNACDAVTKLKRLSSLGMVHDIEDDFRITVTLNEAEKTITVSDNGIGMSEEELKKYICQIALSGALDFIQKYETQEGGEGGKNGIIGHFGLGFYSCFMVSDTVEVISRSYTGAPASRLVCESTGEYELQTNAEKEGRGTDIVMHVTEEEKEYLSEYKLREILNKYCAFMPVGIYFEVVKDEEEEEKEEKKDGEEAKEPEEPKPVNDTHPLWLKTPSECTEEEYKAFYGKVFTDMREPLFQIHINADYPLNFKGILYFPKISSEYESLEGQVKLYYNQVFVADNIKEVIPEYLLMLRGVLDCPDLPLNVSRSYLQNSGYVAKISAHIAKKVADKLNSLFNTEREKYEELWNELRTFVEYACLRDRKFYDRVKDSILLRLTDGKAKTVSEYLEAGKEKYENTVYYTTDPIAQAQYVAMFRDQGIDVAVLDKVLDNQFINMVEGDKNIRFFRVDSDIAQALKGDGEVYENTELTELFRKVSGDKELEVKYEALKDESLPAILNLNEQNRRFDDMMKMYSLGGGSGMPQKLSLVVNSSSSLIRKLGEQAKENADGAEPIAKQIFTLALLSQRQLSAEELRAFLSDSYKILETKL